MYVCQRELHQLVDAVYRTSNNDQQIIDSLQKYDQAILNAVRLRTRLELNQEIEELEAKNFEICHQLLQENRKLQARLTEAEQLLLSASNDRELLRQQHQRVLSLQAQLQHAKQLASFSDEVCTVIGEIEEAELATVQQKNLQENSESSQREQFIEEEKQRLNLLRMSVEQRAYSQDRVDALTRDILESNRQRIRLQQQTIESLCEQLSHRQELTLSEKLPQIKPQLVLAERELLRNYESQIKRLSKEASRRMKSSETLQLQTEQLQQAVDEAVREREQLRLENQSLRGRIAVLIQQHNDTLTVAIDAGLNEKQETVMQLKETILAANSSIAKLKQEIGILNDRIRDMEGAHAMQLAKLSNTHNSHLGTLKGEIADLKQDHLNSVAKINQTHRAQLNDLNSQHKQELRRREPPNPAIPPKNIPQDFGKELQQLRRQKTELEHDLAHANSKYTQQVAVIKGLELEVSRLMLRISQPPKQQPRPRGQPQPASEAVSMRDLDDIISLLTLAL